jgi:hypothetical protein
MKLSEKEHEQFDKITASLDELQKYLSEERSTRQRDLADWFSRLAAIKSIQGNFSQQLSFFSCLLARNFLHARHDFDKPIDAAERPQSAPGLDIRATTTNGEVVVAEIKTTTPYNGDDLGSNQRKSFYIDFNKLARAKANFKYFFLIDPKAYRVVTKRYLSKLKGVTIVCLATGDTREA